MSISMDVGLNINMFISINMNTNMNFNVNSFINNKNSIIGIKIIFNIISLMNRNYALLLKLHPLPSSSETLLASTVPNNLAVPNSPSRGTARRTLLERWLCGVDPTQFAPGYLCFVTRA